MNELQIFENPVFGAVRTVEREDGIWFAGKDVAEALGYRNPSEALADHVDEEDKLNSKTLLSLGQRGGWLINESGVYSLVFSSRLPDAKDFKRWITSEVIPAIRKHGGYLTEQKIEEVLLNPDTIIKLATTLKEEKAKRAEAERQLEEAKPKVVFADAVSASKSSILIGELAKILRQNGIDIGQKRLFAWLRNNGYLIKQNCADYNTPTQKAMEMGLFEIKKGTYVDGNGCVVTTRTVKVTGKGQQYFINKFLAGKKKG